jgi:hypothetical protein
MVHAEDFDAADGCLSDFLRKRGLNVDVFVTTRPLLGPFTHPGGSRESNAKRAMSAQGVSIRKSSAEGPLLEHVRRLGTFSGRGWAFYLHLSRLSSRARTENLAYGLNSFRSVVDKLFGHVFLLKNSDMVVLFKDAPLAQAKSAIRKLQFLFHDDPLFQTEEGAEVKFCTSYNLDEAYPEFLRLVESLAAPGNGSGAPASAHAATASTAAPAAEDKALDPARLGSLVTELAAADISGLLCHQPVYSLAEDAIAPVFEEIYVSIPALERTMTPGVRLAADRWLFQYLTRALDKRMLDFLARSAQRTGMSGAGPQNPLPGLITGGHYSINLNLSTVLSPDFQAFDAAISDAARKAVTLEFQKIDVFADLGSYLYVRDFAHERGYRICLDGLSHLSLPFIDSGALGLDLLKIYWVSDMAEHPLFGTRGGPRELVEQAGQGRVVLCRCDSRKAIDYGRSLGIFLFQGKQLDAQQAQKEGRA